MLIGRSRVLLSRVPSFYYHFTHNFGKILGKIYWCNRFVISAIWYNFGKNVNLLMFFGSAQI